MRDGEEDRSAILLEPASSGDRRRASCARKIEPRVLFPTLGRPSCRPTIDSTALPAFPRLPDATHRPAIFSQDYPRKLPRYEANIGKNFLITDHFYTEYTLLTIIREWLRRHVCPSRHSWYQHRTCSFE